MVAFTKVLNYHYLSIRWHDMVKSGGESGAHGETRDASPASPSREEKAEELRHVLHCGLVREGTHIHALLVYLGAKALDPHEPLKEYTIGVEALGKPPGHDPRIDPTVRVEIAKLRKRLKDYYQGEGEKRPVHLEIPSGSYLPVFAHRVRAAAPDARRRAWASPWTLAAVMSLVSLFLAAALWRQGKPAPAGALEAFWAPHLDRGVPTLLVCGTPMFVKLEGGYYRDTNTNQPREMEASRKLKKVIDALQPDELRPVFTFIGMGETHGVFEITRLLAAQGSTLILRQSHEVSWADFKGRHVIFLGGKKYNPQIPELPYKPAFIAERRRILNLEPLTGEPAEYLTGSATPYGEISEEYALISVYPGLTAGTRLMTLDCSSTEGTMAAAEFLTREDLVGQLLARGVPVDASGGKYPAFQTIIHARFNKSVPVELSYTTHRVMVSSGQARPKPSN